MAPFDNSLAVVFRLNLRENGVRRQHESIKIKIVNKYLCTSSWKYVITEMMDIF